MAVKYINRERLRTILLEKNITHTRIASELGISYNAFYRKMVKGYDFSEQEIAVLIDRFGSQVVK